MREKGFVWSLVLVAIIAIAIMSAAVLYFQFRPEKPLQTQTVTQDVPELGCSNMTSGSGMEKCVGEKVEAIGILECERLGVSAKAGVHYLKFRDGTDLKFLEEYPNCPSYEGKEVGVTGELYRCREGFDQCAGIGLRDIESINLISQSPVIGTINGVEKAKLVEIARSYIKTKPSIHFEDNFISWDEAEKIAKDLDHNYFSNFNPDVDLNARIPDRPLTKWEKWWHKEAVDKYVVRWDPGCDIYKGGEVKAKCLPNYRFFVLIDKDLSPVLIDIIQIQKSE